MRNKILSVHWIAIRDYLPFANPTRAANLIDHGSKRLFHKPDMSSSNWLPRMKPTERNLPRGDEIQ